MLAHLYTFYTTNFIKFIMKNILADINAPTFTLSAIVVGFLLIDDLNPSEQNSIGNWFMMVGQVLCTNASQQQVLNNNTKNTPSDNINNNQNSNYPHIINDTESAGNKDMDTLKRTINQVNQQLNKF